LNRWKNLLALPTSPIFLSFIIAIVNFLDTVARLFFFYTSQVYPLSTYLKPVFFILQTALLAYFIKEFRFSPRAIFLNKKFRILLDFQLVLVTVMVMLYVDSALGSVTGIAIPKQYLDAAWLLIFGLGPVLTAFWAGLTVIIERRFKMIGAIFFFVGVAFLAKPIENFYFWSQTYAGYAFPYSVVAFGMFAPLFLMVSALVIAIFVVFSKVKKTRAWFSLLRSPFLYTTGVIVLIPATLTGVNEGLPNTIIRAVMYWSLGYSGFDWYAASLYLFSFVVYIYLVKQLISNLGSSLPSVLIKLGFASFPWNGLTIMMFGYSSMPGNLLSLDAVVVGLLLLKGHGKSEEQK